MEDKAQIQDAIKAQGEVVRKLKSEKASKDQVSVWRELSGVKLSSPNVCVAARRAHWADVLLVEFGLSYSELFCYDIV